MEIPSPKSAVLDLRTWLRMDAGIMFGILQNLPGACIVRGEGSRRFLYRPGDHKPHNRIVLVAHADTAWDGHPGFPPRLAVMDGVIRSATPGVGIGAAGRAGCAMLWKFGYSGHSILLTRSSEKEPESSRWLMQENPDIADDLNGRHQYMLQLDWRNTREFACCGPQPAMPEFREFIRERTGFTPAGSPAAGDIAVLCRDIPGVTISVGCHGGRTPAETLNVGEWTGSLQAACTLAGSSAVAAWRLRQFAQPQRW